MVSYRFCRGEDIPSLVNAVNLCCDVHTSGAKRLTEERFRREIQELDVWPSNCMIAATDGDPIAVSIATKREHETLVQRIGVRPGHMREGHGSHLLTSLSQKLHILGPQRLVAEIPKEWTGVQRFFEKCEYEFDRSFECVRFDNQPADAPPAGFVTEMSIEELQESGAFDDETTYAWECAPETFINRKVRLRAFAVSFPEQLAGYAVYDPEPVAGASKAYGVRVQAGSNSGTIFTALVHAIGDRIGWPLHLQQARLEEIPGQSREQLGMVTKSTTLRYVATAKPA